MNCLLLRLAVASVFGAGFSLQAKALDPISLAETMPGASWNLVMKEFRKLDRDEDGLLSRVEREIEGEGHASYANRYQFANDVPLYWTAWVNLVWSDGRVSRSEFRKLLAGINAMRPQERAAALRVWLSRRRFL